LFVPRDEALDARWDIAHLQVAAPAEFLGNVGRDVGGEI
jgi:hypothetical protein